LKDETRLTPRGSAMMAQPKSDLRMRRQSPFGVLPFLLFLLIGFDPAMATADAGETPPGHSNAASREELLKLKRQEKLASITPYRLSGMERRMLWLEKSGLQQILNFNYHRFYPRFASLSTGSGFAPGVRYWLPDMGRSGVDLQASGAHSFKGYRLYDLQVGRIQQQGKAFSLEPIGNGPAYQFDDIQPKAAGLFLYGQVRYRHFPQEDFFGPGSNSRKEDRTSYLVEDISYELVSGWQVNRWVGIATRVGLLQSNIEPGTDPRFPATQLLFTDPVAAGLAYQPDFVHLSGALMVDSRDRPGNPHGGGMAGLLVSRFKERSGDQYDFTRAALDLRYYQQLWSEQRVLALRFFTSSDDPDRGSRVPFYLQDSLGGSETLRGFREFRFRDNKLLFLSAEYRWESSPAVELALFYDAGKVFGSASDFGFRHLEKSVGGGVRFKTPQAVIIRLDAGRSREGTTFFFKFGPSF
jgi:hypothetical protein